MPDVTPYKPKGSDPIRIAIVGEASGAQEEYRGEPFVGDAGRELTRMLADAGIIREDCYITNTFLFRPQDNNIDFLCVDKKTADEEWREINGIQHTKEKYPYKQLRTAKYIRPMYCSNRQRLYEELESIQPNVVIALGNTACWALLDETGISKIRGTVCTSPYIKAKVVPTYHPAAILRQWDFRAIAVADLMKAARESSFPEIRKPRCEVWIEPTLEDLHLYEPALHPANSKFITCDIETMKGQITCIGFTPSDAGSAIVVPFYDSRKPNKSYWEDPRDEVLAWHWVQRMLTSGVPLVFQNGLYDIQYLLRLGLQISAPIQDTMILHHSIQPEMEKSLGFLGSIYTEFPSWKHMRPRGKHTQKRDDQ